MRAKRKLLVILRHRFWDHSKGSSMRIRLLLEQLAEDYQIDLFFLRRLGPNDEKQIRDCIPGLGEIGYWKFSLRFAPDLLGALAGCLRHRTDRSRPAAAQPGGLKDWLISHALLRLLRRNSYDVALFEYIWTAKFANTLTAPALPAECWLDTHDVMHLRHASARKAGIAVANPLTAGEEAAFLLPFSRIIAIQPEEAAAFRRLAPAKEVVTIPVVPRADLTPHPRPDGFDASVTHLLHVSSCDPIAVESLRWFIGEIWPAVLNARPDIHLHVIGSICQVFDRDGLHGITLHGFVENLAPYYQHACLAINPCLAGSGLKIKTVEALSFGKIMVTTPFGAQGLDIHATSQLVVCAPADLAMTLLLEIEKGPALRAISQN